MGVLKYAIAVFSVVLSITIYSKLQPPPLPTLDPNAYWGPGTFKKDDVTVKPFTINVSDKELKDFHTRLSLPPRYTPPLEGSKFTYGFDNDVLDKLVHYWTNSYNWKKREQRLNKVPHFTTKIEGLDIHFIHITPKVSSTSKVKVVPLLLIHGWPGSFVEFMDIIPLLTTPREGSSVVFELIVPSLPGYGFSQGSSKKGLGALETGQIFLKLMARLGHKQFYVQGGDWGSLVATCMTTMYPDRILGVHVNMIPALSPMANIKMILGAFLPSGIFFPQSDDHKLYPLSELYKKLLQESGYAHIQASKPDTIGAALNTSPVALLVYIMEKFSTWTHFDNVNHPSGGLLDSKFPISRDAMLDNICIYWFSKSIVTSQRYYAENLNIEAMSRNLDAIQTDVPAGIAAFSQELINAPRNIAETKFTNIVTFKDFVTGGHFAAMQVPNDLADHVFEFVNIVEKSAK